MDTTGLSVCINSFAKIKHKVDFGQILNVCSDQINNLIEKFTVRELMLLLTGMAYNQNFRLPFDVSQGYEEIAEMFAKRLLKTNEIKKLHYRQLTSLSWAYSFLKQSDSGILRDLWEQFSYDLE